MMPNRHECKHTVKAAALPHKTPTFAKILTKTMQKLVLAFFVALLGSSAVQAQEKSEKVYWYTLTGIELDGVWKPNEEPPFPIFSDAVKKLEGKLISIEGYAIPLDPSGNQIVLSANPYAACFFCGKASPASIMSVLFDKPQKLKTDDYITVSGRLQLNSTDTSQPYYTLEHATFEKKK
jgi:hypothetical protein